MPRFLKTSVGYIDLGEVAGAQAIKTGGPRLRGTSRPAGVAHTFFDAAGKELAIAGNIDLEKLTAPIVPAGPTQAMICIDQTGKVTAAVIVGWRVVRDNVEPVFVIQPPPDTVHLLMIAGQGLVRMDDGVLFPNLAAAVAAIASTAAPVPAPAPAPVAPVAAAPVEVEIEIEPTPVMPKAVAGKRR